MKAAMLGLPFKVWMDVDAMANVFVEDLWGIGEVQPTG